MAKSTMKLWSLKLDIGQKITKILVKHDAVVYGIGFQITNASGQIDNPIWFEGTNTPPRTIAEVALNNVDFLTHISGSYGIHEEETCIITMRIHTNLFPEGHGLYGESKEPTEETPFSSPLPYDGSIVEFLGCTDKFLGSIGFNATGKMIKKHGPHGDLDEKKLNWYIKLKEGDRISKLTIRHGNVIDGIGFEVKNDNTKKIYYQEFSGPEDKIDTLPLKDDEVITKISGTYGNYRGKGIKIATITFFTNKQTKSYGTEKEVEDVKKFEYKVPSEGSMVGIYGSYELFLNSIGFSEEIKEIYPYGPYGRIA